MLGFRDQIYIALGAELQRWHRAVNKNREKGDLIIAQILEDLGEAAAFAIATTTRGYTPVADMLLMALEQKIADEVGNAVKLLDEAEAEQKRQDLK